MKRPALERTSAANAGWLIILVMVGWIVFVFWPWPRNPPPARPAAVPLPVTSLTRSGLAEYTDWGGLPEIFAIWADKAEWKHNRTRFAYWHPVMKTYSYYFEATRTVGGFRFKEIAEPHDPDYIWDESLGADCPIRFYINPGHDRKIVAPPSSLDPVGTDDKAKPGKVRVEITLPETKVGLETHGPKP